jgi:hypothetical protein
MHLLNFKAVAVVLATLPCLHSLILPDPKTQQIIAIDQERVANTSDEVSPFGYVTQIQINSNLPVKVQSIYLQKWINDGWDDRMRFQYDNIEAGG